MRSVPWWGVLSSTAAPVLLVGGWTVAAALQPGHFDPVTSTISALAGYGATDRWVMTLGLAGLGICHAGTGLALRPAAAVGRMLLIAGGLAVLVVAANPLPAGGGTSMPHGVAAAVSFTALALWPACAWRRGARGPAAPGILRPTCSVIVALVLVFLLGWFGAELVVSGGQVGLAERALAGGEAVWPLAVVLGARRKIRQLRPSPA
jgi:hypothetical protein